MQKAGSYGCSSTEAHLPNISKALDTQNLQTNTSKQKQQECYRLLFFLWLPLHDLCFPSTSRKNEYNILTKSTGCVLQQVCFRHLQPIRP